MNDVIEHPFINAVLPHLLTVGGFMLAFFLIARLMSEKRQPGNTFAWLLGIVLIPYIGVPLYLLFGGRKLRKLMARKKNVFPTLPGPEILPAEHAHRPIAQAVTGAGGSPPVAGNQVELLTNGEETYRIWEESICNAVHHIHITTFILSSDETGKRIVKLLARRAREGVKVRLLLDAVGCMFISRNFVAPIKKAGGEVEWFMPVLPFTSRGSANLRNHRKIAIFDHTTAIVGGHNLATEYMGPVKRKKRWADFGARIQGPAAALLNDVFMADWCFASRQSAENIRAEIQPEASCQARGNGELQVIASGPDVNGDPLYEGLLAMVQAAEKSLIIITPYFIPDEVLLRSLIVKVRSGCAITLVVPAKSNHRIADFARKHYLRELRHAGVQVKLFGPGMMHCKATLADGRVAFFGSANLDLRSLFVNFEIGVMVHSVPEVRAMTEWAEGLIAHCTDHHPAKPPRFKLLGGLAEDLSRLLAPLL
ncbi:MAG: PLDc N-terminal domain-containing protein [Cephaloticoccus sp.]|nr:PLDc N-terminal domain-containing protein [Cephaloticoccus sp.]MCF7759740.1 PLDc N-terminal domain-containing protein [Cephaloticoccus sp.]